MNKVIITDPRSTAELINEVRARLEGMELKDLEVRADVEVMRQLYREMIIEPSVDRLTREQIKDRPPFVSVEV